MCDCKLKNFRDYVVAKRLYNGGGGAPSARTTCSEPSRLHGKSWDTVSASEFACKPSIGTPFARVFGAPGVDAGLACRILGSPVPHPRWVVGGRIIGNNSHPQPLADQTYIITQARYGELKL